MSRFTFKPINKAAAAKKTYAMHKEWVITDETADNYNVTVYTGIKSNGSWNISDNNDTNISLEDTTTNSYYKREIFDSVHHIYYTDPESATLSSDPEYFKEQTRDLHREAIVVSVPSRIFGQYIKAGTVTMSNASATIYDDGIGNLIDRSISNTATFASFSKDDYHIKMDCNDGWKLQNGNIASDTTFKTQSNVNILDISNGPYEPFGTNISFEYTSSGMYGISGSTGLVLHGSPTVKEYTDSFVEINRSKELGNTHRAWDTDWALSIRVKVPLSQSKTESYWGSFGTSETREYKSHGYSVITTSRGKYWNDTPWELQVYNSSNAKKGHLRFQRGKGGTLSSITSSTALNDNHWHDIVIQCVTGSMQMYVDGTIQSSISDPIANVKVNSGDNIHIGTRPYGKKQRRAVPQFATKGTNNINNIIKYKEYNENYIFPFKGSIDKFRLFNKGLTTAEVSSLYTYKRDSNIIGNVFYNHGMVVVTDLSGSYNNLHNDYTLTFKGTKDITVHNYRCIVEDGEFNVSLNPTCRKNNDINHHKLQGFTSGSEFAPYVSSIGLYDDNNDLLAIGKLAYPVRSPKEIDIIFNVQFDT